MMKWLLVASLIVLCLCGCAMSRYKLTDADGSSLRGSEAVFFARRDTSAIRGTYTWDGAGGGSWSAGSDTVNADSTAAVDVLVSLTSSLDAFLRILGLQAAQAASPSPTPAPAPIELAPLPRVRIPAAGVSPP